MTGAAENDAVTACAASTVTTHVADVPEHLPVHPANTAPTAGSAVNVTRVPETKEWLHAVPQLIPAGVDVTLPCPTTVVDTENVSPEPPVPGFEPGDAEPEVVVALEQAPKESAKKHTNNIRAPRAGPNRLSPQAATGVRSHRVQLQYALSEC